MFTRLARFPRESTTKDQLEYSCPVLLFKAFDPDGVTVHLYTEWFLFVQISFNGSQSRWLV